MNLWNNVMSFFRGAVPTLKTQRLIALVLLLCQGGITVSGSIVRVTGSGLGCNTWPECHPGSLVPLQGAAPLVHQAIEFGNRLLTFVVGAAAVAAIVAVHMARRRKELKIYAWLSLAGIAVQAILGAISVFLELRWWAVAVHFLPSMVLVWIAALLYSRLQEPDDGSPVRVFPQSIRVLATIATVALSVVLITGTMVTGSGVHSGDDGVGMDGRLEVDTQAMAVTHAMCMYVYLIFTVLVVFMVYRHNCPAAVKKAGWVLIACILVQWAVGVGQVYLHIPRWTVPIHIGMSSVVTAYTALLWAHGKRLQGGTEDLITGSVSGDKKYEDRQSVLAQR